MDREKKGEIRRDLGKVCLETAYWVERFVMEYRWVVRRRESGEERWLRKIRERKEDRIVQEG